MLYDKNPLFDKEFDLITDEIVNENEVLILRKYGLKTLDPNFRFHRSSKEMASPNFFCAKTDMALSVSCNSLGYPPVV